MDADERGYVYTERKEGKDKLAAILKVLFCFICVYLRSSAAEFSRGWKNGHFRRISGWIA
jgi:hypothetical protein